MTGRRAIISLCALCALAFCAAAAQTAAGATLGTTAFTCKKLGKPQDFTKAHCKGADLSPGNGEYGHVAIPENTTTEVYATNAATGANTETSVLTTLHSVQAGITFEIQAKSIHGEGWLTNAKDPVTGEHYVHGEIVLNDTEAEVVKPAGKGCKIKGGKIVSEKLKATTKGQGMALKVEPAAGALISKFEVEGCSIAALNGAYELKGSAKCKWDGATCYFNPADTTTEGTLTLRGQKAGVENVLTITGKDAPKGDTEYTPISVTTVETP
ncbi:MAG TPA: hypothetical protein VGO24_01860 [Solirubrobacterales bacterium]|jgi:hypothetical protein|nr:hypothetical protein [Solirubrobacterales bacterium]